jgi:hypothetical protein
VLLAFKANTLTGRSIWQQATRIECLEDWKPIRQNSVLLNFRKHVAMMRIELRRSRFCLVACCLFDQTRPLVATEGYCVVW